MTLNIIKNESKKLTKGEMELLNKIRKLYKEYQSEAYLYVQPTISNLIPDFILIDEKRGILREITLTSVDKAHLLNGTSENVNIVESGTPVFLLDGNIKNGLCDQVMDFDVYLSMEFIMVNFSEERYPYKFVELERVRFGFDKDDKLISVIVKDLSSKEYSELKDGLKL